MPKLHKSVFSLYSSPLIISGEEYKKIPICSDLLSLIKIEQLKFPNFISFFLFTFSVSKKNFWG